MLRKHELVIALQKLSPHPKPKVALEQYTIPADLAAEILFTACYARGDIEGKSIVDLGTGTGRLALGASMLGADYVVGVDLDKESIGMAVRNCERLGLCADWILGEIEILRGQVDTVLMNPPFGTKKPHADIRFLQTALRIGKVIYSIHKYSTREFLTRWIRDNGAKASIIVQTRMEIPHIFDFHKKKHRYVDVDVFRIVR